MFQVGRTDEPRDPVATLTDPILGRQHAFVGRRTSVREVSLCEVSLAPVPHLSRLRCYMSMATAMKWKTVGVDLIQGFIQADLSKDGKDIYISPPPGHAEK